MRILLAHNYTMGFSVGGEGHVFEDEARQLEERGHEVRKLFCTNSEATDASLAGKIRAFQEAPWSRDGYERMARAIREFKPDIIHVHNFFLILSPSIFKAAHDAGVPAVVTLHNYRMAVPCSQLLRRGQSCELCVGRNPWRILVHRCYKKSFWASLLRYRIYYLSRLRYGWDRYVSTFIALTDFMKEKLIAGGLPPEKIAVKANCVKDPLAGSVPPEDGYGALYVGTITHDKGVRELVEAWKEIDYPLDMLGEGALRQKLAGLGVPKVRLHGLAPRAEVLERLRRCAFLILPSICYEGCPLALIEAMSMGKPVIASDHGAMRSMVRDGQNGFLFRPGDVGDLRKQVHRLIGAPELIRRMGQGGRAAYLAAYTPQRNYEKLMHIYENALAGKPGHVE